MKLRYRIDASSLVQSACLLRWKRIMMQGYCDKVPWNDTWYGSCFHRFCSVMAETKNNFGEATLAAQSMFDRPLQIRPNKKHLTAQHLIKTCHDFFLHFAPKDSFELMYINDKPLVEVEFENEVYEDDEIIISLVGTIDKIGKILNGAYCIGDYKTHSLFSVSKDPKYTGYEIQEFFKKFELSLQLRFYLYNLKLKAKKFPDTELARICEGNVGVFIDGVFMSTKEPTLFKRSDVFTFKDWQLNQLEQLITQKVEQVKFLHKNPKYSTMDGIITGACVDGRFPCMFHKVCACGDETISNILLTNDYNKREYNPLLFSKQ